MKCLLANTTGKRKCPPLKTSIDPTISAEAAAEGAQGVFPRA